MRESDAHAAPWVPQKGALLEGRYRVLGNLSHGGMGVLLRARDEQLDRDVAVKLMSPRLARTGNYRGRFEREVELASRLDHPHVIRCHDYGVTEHGAMFLVMELLDGLGLREVIRNEGRLSTARAVDLGLQLLRGLAAAHALGIVHRDLKPDNVYVVEDKQGRQKVKLLDFGLAKSLEDEHIRLTKTGMICGTAAYVAPETLVVEAPGREADVYAVGLIMLEMLFGRRVYSSPQMAQTFMEQLVVPARIPRRVWEQPLGRILRRALQKHPGERYADAAAMLDALSATVGEVEDLILSNEEIPPGANELPRELLDDLADGRYRTIDTLYKLPAPEAWDPGDEVTIDDRATLRAVLDEISRSDIHAAFDTIVKRPASDARPTVRVDYEKPTIELRDSGALMAPAPVRDDLRDPPRPPAPEEPPPPDRTAIYLVLAAAIVGLLVTAVMLLRGDDDAPVPTPPRAEPKVTAVTEPVEPVIRPVAAPSAAPVVVDVGVAFDMADAGSAPNLPESTDEVVRPPPKERQRPKRTRTSDDAEPVAEPTDEIPSEAADWIVDKYLPKP